jgi:dipeptidyl aminopeptidase/acylaminoacyl peptidase
MARWMTAFAFVACAAVPAVAQNTNGKTPQSAAALIPTSVFAARSPFGDQPQLSPDGKRMAYSLVKDNKTWLGVIDIDSGEIVRKLPLGEDIGLRWFSWAGNDRLLLGVAMPFDQYYVVGRMARLFVSDLKTRQSYYVGPNGQGLYGDNVLYTDPAGQFVLLSVQPVLDSEPEVWRFALDGTDVKGLKIEGKGGIWQWMTDERGVVRLGLGYANGKIRVWYRKTAEEPLRVVAKVNPDDKDELWDVVRLLAGTDEGLVLEPGPSGHVALRKFDYATRQLGAVVYENPDWDVSQVDLDEGGKPLAVHFTDEADRVQWLDPAMAKLQANLEKALGGGQVIIAQRARDGSRVLVWHGTAGDPGTWYVYTAASHNLAEFSQVRPELDAKLLAPVKPVEFPVRDGTRIHAYLTLPRQRAAKNLPLVIMPHGGPYGVRDKLEYSDEVQLLANRGYAVLQPNYRGSDGYGDAFEELGKGEIGRKMQDDLDDAMDWAVAQGIADPKRVCLVGESYGGYAALWGVIRNPERYRCAASFAGVTDWGKQLAYQSDFLERHDRPAWREKVRGTDRKFDLASVSPARNADKLTRPILLVQGRKDKTVPVAQYDAMRFALHKAGNTSAQYLLLADAVHGFPEAKDEQAWYDALVGFLAKNNPPD